MSRQDRKQRRIEEADQRKLRERLQRVFPWRGHEPPEAITPSTLRYEGLVWWQFHLERVRSLGLDLGAAEFHESLNDALNTLHNGIDLELDRAQRQYACARWCSQGFPVVQMPEIFAASMASTEPSEEALEDLHSPWSAFLIELPEGLVELGAQHAHSILVHWAPESAYPWNYFLVWTSGEYRTWRVSRRIREFIGAPNSFVVDHNGADPADAPSNRIAARIIQVADRIVANVCCYATSYPEHVHRTPRKPSARAARSEGGKRSAPEFTYFAVGRPVAIDVTMLKDDVRDEIAGGRRGSAHTVRTIVRGHWRHQAHGPRHALRKWQWIDPYVKGPDDAPVVLRPHVIDNTEESN